MGSTPSSKREGFSASAGIHRRGAPGLRRNFRVSRYPDGRVGPRRSFVERLEAQCSKPATLPGILGRPRPELRAYLRSFPFGAYMVFFRDLEDKLEVVKIVRSHRDLDALFGEPSD
ncbi:MAG: type II toxin-antitoxin system RelE/ParE family toxin [Methylobacteriaceae bacterium]|nr:type II toxin-antitoxin system RelE/ParE family toxin [Methylobacteriaceae bacterium]